MSLSSAQCRWVMVSICKSSFSHRHVIEINIDVILNKPKIRMRLLLSWNIIFILKFCWTACIPGLHAYNTLLNIEFRSIFLLFKDCIWTNLETQKLLSPRLAISTPEEQQHKYLESSWILSLRCFAKNSPKAFSSCKMLHEISMFFLSWILAGLS